VRGGWGGGPHALEEDERLDARAATPGGSGNTTYGFVWNSVTVRSSTVRPPSLWTMRSGK